MNNQELITKYVSKERQKEALELLEQGVPIQYIIGNVDFCGNIINVDNRVLIPRFETETLVDKTISYAKKMFTHKLKIIDLGTGSGCIAISLKKAMNAEVYAMDISSDALDLAKKNALENNVDILFLQDSMENPLVEKFDIIISNPPYIPYDGFVQDIVQNNEPKLALFALDDGLYFYKKILGYAFDCLNKPGLIAFEIGDSQKELLESYLKKYFRDKKYCFETDLAGMIRYLFIFNE
ncbi:MAG: peptide chain release factor N(5)-glutamine methyltransferase [Bacilli bacterium]|nr:peptide chain release factor N(5)-glutamine methyltransferase [Bacilli bacterium]